MSIMYHDGNRRRTTDRAGRSARHFPQFPALYPEHADDRAVDLYPAAELRVPGAGLERLRRLQGRRASARADLERIVIRVKIRLAMQTAAHALTQQFLVWVAEANRSRARPRSAS